MNPTARWSARVCLLLRLVALAAAAYPLRAQGTDSLTSAIARALTEEGLVGATWTLVTPERTMLGAAGAKDLSRRTLLRPHDRMQVGSVAKTVVATGVLQLVTLGRVKLDAPLTRYLPDLPIENPWERTSPLTARHLLDHTAGLDDARMWQVFTMRASSDDPLRDGLVHAGGALRVRHQPGERFSYSNTGFLLAGLLIEAVTGERYERWLDRELLAPLLMTHSTVTFVTQAGPQADTTLAMGHFDSLTTAATIASPLRPAGQFTTTAEDMARFARFLMSDGRVDGNVLVHSALLRAMSVATTTEAARAGLAVGYGLGLARRDRQGAVGRCHLGNSGTFRAALCLFPEQQRAYFISHNTDPENANFGRVDSLLTHALGVSTPTTRAVQSPSVDPSEWNGLYRARPNRFAQFAYLDELTGTTRVRWDGGALHLQPLQGAARELLPVGGAAFRLADRREASHVLLRAADGAAVIGDGQRTLERVQPATVYLHRTSAVLGLASLLYLLVVGGFRSVRARGRGTWREQPLRWPALCLALLITAPALYLTEPFLAIGDPTIANIAMAVVSGLLPLSLLVALAHLLRLRTGARAARLDLAAIGGALQWCVVLAWWGLLPLALWR